MTHQPMTEGTRRNLLALLSDGARLADGSIDGVAAHREMFARLGMAHVAELYRVLEFALLLRFDISILFADFIRREHEPAAHVYARFVILTIYEGSATYRRLLGKHLQDTLAANADARPLLPRIRALHKAMSSVAKEAVREYRDIRHGIAAHRDENAVVQLRRLRSVGGEELALSVERFTRASMELERLFAELTAGIKQTLDTHLSVIGLHPGQSASINVNVTDGGMASPQPLPGEELDWETSDPAVATVDATGTVYAVSFGHARITFIGRSTPASGGAFVFVGTDAQIAEMNEHYSRLLHG